jgi:hypothetical protein
MMTVMAMTQRYHDADVVDHRDVRGHPVLLHVSVVAGTVETGETMSTFPLVRTGCLGRCILAVLLSTVSGGMSLRGMPSLRTDAPPWRSTALHPPCLTGQLHIPRPCGTLSAVVAISSTDIWAVGGNPNTSPAQPLIEHWDGKHWRIVPAAPRTVGALSAVSAISPTDVWAVGLSQSTPLIEHWDGTRWSRVPDGGSSSFWPRGVAAVSPRDVWAVGMDFHTHPLVKHWDGVQWRSVPVPAVRGYLAAVVAVSAHDIWAAGAVSDLPPHREGRPLLAHWNGTRWRLVIGPHIGRPGTANTLSAITAISTNNVWAVGSYDATGLRAGTGAIILHWDGRSWHPVASPNIPGSARYNVAGIELTSVSAVSPDDVWAVSQVEIATEHWDGTRWRIVASPRVRRNTIAALSAVAAIGPRDAWAVGTVLGETVAAHWNGVRWGIAPSPNTNI